MIRASGTSLRGRAGGVLLASVTFLILLPHAVFGQARPRARSSRGRTWAACTTATIDRRPDRNHGWPAPEDRAR